MSAHISKIGSYLFIQFAAWTAVIAISLVWNINVHQRGTMNLVRQLARTHIDRDFLYRSWNELNGGVYVKVSEFTQPNPNIDKTLVPERDITTTGSMHLTLMNPAYMNRQVYEISEKETHVTSRLTSLRPVRYENRPDEWESEALKSFELGNKESSKVATIKGKKFFRLIRPVVTEKNCLRCHSKQNYKTGDIRGGISVMLPMDIFENALKQEIATIWIGHGGLWLLGMLGIAGGMQKIRKHVDERNKTSEELKKANLLLQHQASTDMLTGICNRQKCLEVIYIEMKRAGRYGTPLTLIMFDFDNFKAINDNYGHDVGDLVLIQIAALVSENIRTSDLLARWGGEEFMIVSPGTTIEEGAKLAEKLRLKIENHAFPVTGRQSCSFGVSTLHVTDNVETLTKRADEAMYKAKRNGRNLVRTEFKED